MFRRGLLPQEKVYIATESEVRTIASNVESPGFP